MSGTAPPPSGTSWKLIVRPGSPAPPASSAHTDQPNAASTPTEIRVSMVAARCRRLATAARWNGQPPHTTTGGGRAGDSHCKNRSGGAGPTARATTGTVRAAQPSNRWGRPAVSPPSPDSGPDLGPASGGAPAGAAPAGAGGSGRRAVYPVAS